MAEATRLRTVRAMSWQTRTGIVLVVVSCVLYAALIGVPFLPVDGATQLAIAAGLVIVGEGTFWVGCLIAGKEFMIYLRKWLWPGTWRRRVSAR